MTLPEIRAEIYQIVDLVAQLASRLQVLAEETKRRPHLNRAPRTSAPMTPLLVGAIREYKDQHPTASQAHIGRVFNVNSGRVSVALRGYRT